MSSTPTTPTTTPSAGDGALIDAVRAEHPAATVHAVEIDSGRTRLLGNRADCPGPVRLWGMTAFQDYAAGHLSQGRDPYDAVVINPPFTETSDRHAWATHFLAAWSLLRDGGRMVAVLPSSYRFHEVHVARAVRALVERCGGGVEDLPDGTFKGAGTSVRTVLVTVTKGWEHCDGCDAAAGEECAPGCMSWEETGPRRAPSVRAGCDCGPEGSGCGICRPERWG